MSILLSCQNQSFYTRYGKRILDVVLSSLALLVLSPLFCLVILLIHVDSRGSPFFLQKRFGRGVKPFRLVKFRSMVSVANDSRKDFEPGCSARITRVGKILRKTKVDELPALFNVLRGDMSIVGPRPEVGKYVWAYPEDYRDVLTVRPGLSDFASLKYRNEEGLLAGQQDPESFYMNVVLPDKIRLAKAYVSDIKWREDFMIMFLTLKHVVSG